MIGDRLSKFTYRAITITTEIEDLAIALRRARKVKLPDAIIAETAIHHCLELLTFDIRTVSPLARPVPRLNFDPKTVAVADFADHGFRQFIQNRPACEPFRNGGVEE